MQYFISAIGTDSGKTLASAILVEALKADYWKPVQAGLPRDTDRVIELVGNETSKFHREAYCLNSPMSPHAAAKIDGVDISIEQMSIPDSQNTIIIEGAGGLMVPLNTKEFMIDLPVAWNTPVILVVNLYLGSINHTLLSIESLKNRNITVKGIIFNGKANPESEDIILRYSGYKVLLRIPQLDVVDRAQVKVLSIELLKHWE